MATFGETLIEIVWTIIRSIVETTVRVAQLILQLFGIVSANSGQLGALHLMILVFILAVVLFAFFKMVKGDLKHLLLAFIVFAFLILISLFIL